MATSGPSLTACLLHNEPASYCPLQGEAMIPDLIGRSES
jgi:hypothetical protein